MKNKARLYLQGGFGNVLFQLIAFLHLKEKHENCVIVTILTEKNVLTRILGWKIHDEAYKILLEELNINVEFPSVIQTLRELIFGKLSKSLGKSVQGIYFYNDRDNDLSKDKVHFGYYQSKSFLLENKEHIAKIGRILNLIYKVNSNKLKTDIVVHIRLGDSGWAKKNEYYYKEVIKILNHKKEPFTVITDSIQDAKLLFKGFKNTYFESNSVYEDFGLMLHSKTIFIAPSTFSYWAVLSSKSIETIYMPEMIYSKFGFPFDKKINLI